MSKVLLVALVFFLSCDNEPNVEPIKKDLSGIGNSVKRNDTALSELSKSQDRIRNSIRFLDSNLKYARLHHQAKNKMFQAEADYYRTGNNKFYNRFYRFQKEANSYVRKANIYHDSLQNN